jgi:hypothetical protein
MTIKTLLAATALIGALDFSAVAAQTISNQNPISFGQMVVGGSGTVTVDTASDTRNSTGAVALVGSALVQRGSFDVTFTPGAQIIISMPATLAMTGANTPTLAPTLLGGAIQTIPPGGILTVYLGGTITFSTSGSYGTADTTVPVTVDPF